MTQEEFDRANANMRNVVQGKKKNPATKKKFSVIVCPYCGLTLRPGKRQDSFMYLPYGADASGQPMQCGKDTERCGGADTGRACADAVTAFGDGRAGIEREDTEKKKGYGCRVYESRDTATGRNEGQ